MLLKTLGVAEKFEGLPALVGSAAHLTSRSLKDGAADVDIQIQDEQEQSEVFTFGPRHLERR